MKPAKFDYFKPTTLQAALDVLAERPDDFKILAGGQSLLPALNFRLARPAALLDINELSELQHVRASPDALHIGAITRHCYFHRPAVDGPLGALLSKVVHNIAHYPIRQRGTFAGSLAHADPASEWCLVTQTLGAKLVIRSKRGERVVAADNFFRGTFTTALESDEILVEIRLPQLGKGWTSGFYEFSRRKGDFALAMSLAALRLENGVVREALIGLGGVSDRPIKLSLIEQSLIDERLTDSTIEAAGRLAQHSVKAVGDIHATPEYRSDLIFAVVCRALHEAAGEAKTGI